jgi:1-acyl-sn-glycerol-3-phosphate acyltransferase
MIRTLFAVLCALFLTGFFGIGVIFASLIDNRGELQHKIARVWGRCLLSACRVTVHVRGCSNIEPSGTYIFMANHQSNFDIPVLQAHLSSHFKWLAKAELYKIPFFGMILKRAGYISIDRSNRESAIESLKIATEKIRQGVSVLIFPEGSRSMDGNIRPFKKGGFFLAIDSGVPIVPVILHGTWPIMSKKTGLRVKSGNVVVEIEKPVETTGYTQENREELLRKVHSIIRESFEKGKKEMLC